MMKKLLVLASNTLVLAEVINIEPISVEEIAINSDVYIVSEKDSLKTRSITLQDKLERSISFTTVTDSKGETSVSFRGLDYKNTNYIEDGIPLYRSVNGLVDASLNMANVSIQMTDGTGVSSLGVASAGGEVELKSQIPKDDLELGINTTVSSNDEFFNAYVGSMNENVYIQTNLNLYHQSDYKLSQEYEPTQLQGKGKRINSDREQLSLSLKSGIFVNDNLHLASKVSISQAEYGLVPNTYTNVASPVWDAYSRIDKKSLASFNLYVDYTNKDFEFTWRGYYDKYKDVWALYNDSFYTSTSPLTTYDDSRIGTIFTSTVEDNKHLNSVIFQVEQNEHIRLGGGMSTAVSQVNTFKASYLHIWNMSNFYKLEGGLSSALMQETKSADASASNPTKDKRTYDGQIKVSYTDQEKILYLGIARKSRLPIMAEMFTFFPWDNANPNLKPEKSLQYTTGYQYLLDETSDIDFSLYYYDIKDLIIYRNSTYINRDSAQHYGLELRYTNQYFDKHELHFSYGYAHARDSQGEALQLIPKHQLKVEDSIDLSKDMKAYLSYRFMSSRYSANTATYSDEQMKLSDYHLFEGQVMYEVSDKVNARVGIKNILDEDYEYEYGYPVAGRSYYVSLEWKL